MGPRNQTQVLRLGRKCSKQKKKGVREKQLAERIKLHSEIHEGWVMKGMVPLAMAGTGRQSPTAERVLVNVPVSPGVIRRKSHKLLQPTRWCVAHVNTLACFIRF